MIIYLVIYGEGKEFKVFKDWRMAEAFVDQHNGRMIDLNIIDYYLMDKCPICGANKEYITTEPEDEFFRGRFGCLKCNNWFSKREKRG